MNEEVAALVVRLEATEARFKRQLQRSERTFGRSANNIDRRAAKLNMRLAKTGDRFGQGLSRQGRASLINFGQQLQDVAVQAQMGTDSLRIFSQQGPQILSVFGPAGVLLGVVAAAGGAIATSFLGASSETATLADATDRLGEAMRGLESAEKLAALSLDELRDKFGENLMAVNEYRVALAELSVAEARRELESLSAPLDDLIDRLSAPVPDFDGPAIAAGIQGEQFRNTLAQIQDALGVSEEAAIRLNAALLDIGNADGFDVQVEAMERLLVLLDEIGIDLADLPPELRDAVKAMSTLTLEAFAAEKAASDLEAALARGTDETGSFVTEMTRLRDAADEAAHAAERAFTMRTSQFSVRFRDEERLMNLPVEPSPIPRSISNPGGSSRRRSGSRRASAPRVSAFDRAQEGAADRIRQLQEEARLVGVEGRARAELEAAFDRERLARALVAAAQRDGSEATAAEITLAQNLAREAETLTLQIFDEAEAWDQLERSTRDAREEQERLQAAIVGVGEGLVTTASQASTFEDALKGIARQLLEVGANAVFGLGPLGGAFNGLIGSAGGGVFGLAASALGFGGVAPLSAPVPAIRPFARGGIVNAPEIFPMRGGLGLRGEAGPEAVLPLTRKNGVLGVNTSGVTGGAGGVSVTIYQSNHGVNAAARAVIREENALLERRLVEQIPSVASSGFGRQPKLRR